MDYGFGVPTRGPYVCAASAGRPRRWRRGDGIQLHRRLRPHSGGAPHRLHLPLQRKRHVHRLGVRRMPGAAYPPSLPGRPHHQECGLLSSVMVVPHRNPVHAAKILSTIDNLSGGRLTVGCGAGWMREEFEAIGTPPFDNRGSVSDEYIRVFKELWTSDAPAFEGKYASFSDIIFSPQPIQKPHPPHLDRRRKPRRAAPGGSPGRCLVSHRQQPHLSLADRPAAFRSHPPSSRLRRTVRTRPRGDRPRFQRPAGTTKKRPALAPDGERLTFTGTPQQIAEDILSFQELGVRHLMLGFQAPTLDQTLARMGYFASEIMPLTMG